MSVKTIKAPIPIRSQKNTGMVQEFWRTVSALKPGTAAVHPVASTKAGSLGSSLYVVRAFTGKPYRCGTTADGQVYVALD